MIKKVRYAFGSPEHMMVSSLRPDTHANMPNSHPQKNGYHRLLGNLLIDGGLVSAEEIDCALKVQARDGGRLGDILLRSGNLDKNTLKAVLRLQKLLDEAESSDAEIQLLLNKPLAEGGQARVFTSLRLGELLLAQGEISKDQLRKAIYRQRRSNKPLGELLIEAGWLTSKELQFYLRLQKGLKMAAATATLVLGQQAVAYAQHTVGAHTASSKRPVSQLSTANPQRNTDPRWASLAGAKVEAVETENAVQPSSSDRRFSSVGGDLGQYSITARREALKEKREIEKAQKRARIKKLEALKVRKAQAKALRAAMKSEIPDYEAMHKAVNKHASEFSIPKDLIYAIIQTESSFNPNARSPANAYGLMQVVPTSAGAEVHRLLKNCNSRPTSRQLLNPHTNVYFGTAYLRILLDYYFVDVENTQVKLGLAIAAYNMGPSRLVTLIKRKGPPENIDALRNMLRAHAPKETQDYLDKVLSRRAQYLVLRDGFLPHEAA